MSTSTGYVAELRVNEDREISALVNCRQEAAPAAGQYLQAYAPDDTEAVLPASLFPTQHSNLGSESPRNEFVAAPPIPPSWQPGTTLHVRGPLGAGFSMPAGIKRLGLAAIGSSTSRLLPLIDQAAEIALFTQTTRLNIPAEIEVNPLSALSENLAWADFLAIDCPLEQLPALRDLLGLEPDAALPARTQILLSTPMPCGGLGDCGVCALKAKRGYKLACVDGPVFDLGELSW